MATAQSVVGSAVLTHGTLESRQLNAARAFYEQGLGLRSVRHAPPAQLIAGAGEVVVVCVEAGHRVHEQGSENRWIVLVPDEATVTKVHDEVARHAAEWGTLEFHAPERRGDELVFVVRDADSNWWEVTNRSRAYYQHIFERGDIA